MNKFWHICNGRALLKIQSEGLVPLLGARSVRFGKVEETIHVCSSVDSAVHLAKIPLWATNPENLEFGQMLIEIQSDEAGVPDPDYQGGIVLTQGVPADRISFIRVLTEPLEPQVYDGYSLLQRWGLELLRWLRKLISRLRRRDRIFYQ